MPNIRPLSPELQLAAEKELGEDPSRTEKDLEHIKEWLKKQPHLTARTDDQFLVTFLRGCKFSLERTKEKIDSFYTTRTALPDYFANRDPMDPRMQRIFDLGLYLPLPETDDQGRRVVLQRMLPLDPEQYPIQDLFKANFFFLEVLLREDDNGVVKGFVGIMDMKGATIAHAMQFQPSLIKKTTTCFQDGYPIRMKGMHHINLPSFFDKIYGLFKSFMKEKLQRRIYVHRENMETLYESIPKRILPKEYGGDGPTLQELTAQWKKKVESHRDYFLEDSKYFSNEKKRPGKPKTHEDIFGLEGSFRQLSFD